MHSFNGFNDHLRRKSTKYNNYRYPSYLMNVAPPQAYSCVDIRNMLVPKTYGKRMTSSLVTSHSSLDVSSVKSCAEFKDAGSTTRQDFNAVKKPNKATAGHQKRYSRTSCKTYDLSLGRKSSDNDDASTSAHTANANGLLGEKKREGGKTVHGQESKESLRINRSNVADETTTKNKYHNASVDSVYASRDSGSTSMRENIKTQDVIVTIEDDPKEKCGSYGSKNREEDCANKSPDPPLSCKDEVIDDIKFIQKCKNCHKTKPFDDFTWDQISEADKTMMMGIVIQTPSKISRSEKTGSNPRTNYRFNNDSVSK